MKNQELQKSVVKAGIILVLFVFFIYAFAAGDSGGVTGTISSLFSGALFLFGLALSVAVSVACMIGIYFGILYLYDQDTCRTTYDEFKVKLNDSAKSFSCCSSSTSCSTAEEPSAVVTEDDLNALRISQSSLESKLNNLQSSVANIEKAIAGFSSSLTGTAEKNTALAEKLDAVGEGLEGKAEAASVDETTKKLAADITAVQGSVKPLSDKLTDLDTVKEELDTLKSSIENLTSASAENADETHRILSHFTDDNDEKDFVKFVAEAVSKGMTYAQIDDFLNESLSDDASALIAKHPSLTKDYIKSVRQKS